MQVYNFKNIMKMALLKDSYLLHQEYFYYQYNYPFQIQYLSKYYCKKYLILEKFSNCAPNEKNPFLSWSIKQNTILTQIRLNDIDLPKINKKDGYTEKTFINTVLLPNMSVNT